MSELIAKVASLETNIENIYKDIKRVEDHVSTIDDELDDYKSDLQEAITQCKGIANQVAEIFTQIKESQIRDDEILKELNSKSTELLSRITTDENRISTCEKERKETIWQFIKDNPEKASKITLLVLFIVFIFSIVYFGSIKEIFQLVLNIFIK